MKENRSKRLRNLKGQIAQVLYNGNYGQDFIQNHLDLQQAVLDYVTEYHSLDEILGWVDEYDQGNLDEDGRQTLAEKIKEAKAVKARLERERLKQ